MRGRDDEGTVHLIDFGAVKDVAKATIAQDTVAGTFGYMAPEQLEGRATTGSDIYSLGMTLLHLVVGRHPSELPQRRLKPMFRDRVNLPEALASVLERMVEPIPEDRFETAVEARHAWRQVAAPPPSEPAVHATAAAPPTHTPARPDSAPPTSGKTSRWKIGLMVLAVLVVGGPRAYFGVWPWYGGGSLSASHNTTWTIRGQEITATDGPALLMKHSGDLTLIDCKLTAAQGPALVVNHNNTLELIRTTVESAHGTAIEVAHGGRVTFTDSRVHGRTGLSASHDFQLQMSGGEISGDDAAFGKISQGYSLSLEDGAVIRGDMALPPRGRLHALGAKIFGQLRIFEGEVLLEGGTRVEGEEPAITHKGLLRVLGGSVVIGGVKMLGGKAELIDGLIRAEGTVLETSRGTTVEIGEDLVLEGIIDAPEGAEIHGLSPRDSRLQGAPWMRDDWSRATCDPLWAEGFAVVRGCYDSVSPGRAFQGRVEGKLIVTLSAGGVIDGARFEGLATQGVGLCLAQHVRGTRLADYTGGPAQVHCKYWGLIEADGPGLKQKTRFLPIVAHDLDPERDPPGP